MKRLLILVAVLLTGCAPLAQLAQPAERATLTRDGLTLTLTNPGPDALAGDPARADGPALTVQGTGLMPDAQATQWCKAASATSWACDLPDVPAGSARRVTFVAGTIRDAAVFGYRPGLGPRPVVIWLSR